MPGVVVHIPTVGGAIAIIYNLPQIGSGMRFTPEVLAGIYLGQIKSWNDQKIQAANPKMALPNLPIRSVHRADGSGTTYIFTNYLSKISGGWKQQVGAAKTVNWIGGLSGKGNPGVAATVSRTPGSIGYVELAFAVAQNLPYGSVKNRSGNYVTPSSKSVTSAINKSIVALNANIKTPIVDAAGVNSYPISGLTYVLLYKDGGGKAVKLWQWVMDKGQQAMAVDLLYAPLPASLLKINLASLKSIH